MYYSGFEEDLNGKRTARTWEYRHTCGALCWEMMDSAYCAKHRYFLQGMPQEWIDVVSQYFSTRKGML